MPFLFLLIPHLQSWISVAQAIRTDSLCFLDSFRSDFRLARAAWPGLIIWGHEGWDMTILPMCNKFPVTQKMPRHVINQLPSSYFLCIFFHCMFLDMHYAFSSLLSISPSTLCFVLCCLLAHKYKMQCRTMEDTLLCVEQKLRRKDSWPCLQWQRHGSG